MNIAKSDTNQDSPYSFMLEVRVCIGRQRGHVVSVSDSQSSGLGFDSRSDHFLDLFLGSAKFKSSATLVSSKLVCLRPVAILNNINVMFNLKHLFQLFAINTAEGK